MLLESFPFVIFNNAIAFVYGYIEQSPRLLILTYFYGICILTLFYLLNNTVRGYQIRIAFCFFFTVGLPKPSV